MCYINWRHEEEYDFYDHPPSPGPRPLPRLEWAVPVNIAELGASLQAYNKQLQLLNTFRMCHRFRPGPLSKLPHEIIDNIISVAHKSEKSIFQIEWYRQLSCFQGRCTRLQHVASTDAEIETLWRGLFVNRREQGCCEKHDRQELKLKGYSITQKMKILEEELKEGDVFPDSIWEAHYEGRQTWIDRVCLCSDPTITLGEEEHKFQFLNNVLKSHFGLEAVILHEALSTEMQRFLPDTYSPMDGHYNTVCFLVLKLTASTKATSQGRRQIHTNRQFLHSDNHLAFYQSIDVANLMIDEERRLRFARALRILDIRPHFDLSELESLITPSNKDESVWRICDNQLAGCPAPSTDSLHLKTKELQQYMEAKDQELAKRKWPQLIMMATSDAVGATTY